ncbi:MAG TPA: hypothetical protein VGL24_02305 [Chthoniobacterales bacterium]
MKWIALSAVLFLCGIISNAQNAGNGGLHLVQRIPLTGVEGRIDHCAIDLAGERLFVAALGNNSVEVIDLRKGARVHSITGLGNPQGVGYAPESGRLIVANDTDGLCNIYDGKTLALTGSVALKDDADNVRYDGATKLAFVGFGKGGICAIDLASAKRARSFALQGHPEAFVLERNGPRIFVNVPGAHHVAVIDRERGKVITTWTTGSATENFPIALDQAQHRLFVGCRSPAELVVLNSDSGAVVTTVPIPGDADDVFLDEKKHRLFVTCGVGSVAVIDQVNADTYQSKASIATAPGARTGLFVPELKSLFVAVPKRGSQSAEIRRYSVD